MSDPKAVDQDLLPPGTVISDRYEIEGCLGTGGMGCVYKAIDRMLENRRVALKILHKEIARDKALEKRFLREVQLMHSVNHPNVVRTFDIGREGSVLYFTMEYVQGHSLSSMISPKTLLDIPRIANLAVQMATGLEAIHIADIVHRDLKPQNILVAAKDLVKITDFGVARPKSSELTQHTEMLGSVDYMAPEVWQGKQLTRSVDVYSFGIILYQLVTGRLPFESDQTASLMWLHIKSQPIAPRDIRPEIPGWINQLILRLLAKSPAERPDSMKEVVGFIRSYQDRTKPGGTSITERAGATDGSAHPPPQVASKPQPTKITIRPKTLSEKLELTPPLSLVFVSVCAMAYIAKLSYGFLKGVLML